MSQTKFKPYRAPAGGWGSAYSVANILLRERVSPAGIGRSRRESSKVTEVPRTRSVIMPRTAVKTLQTSGATAWGRGRAG